MSNCEACNKILTTQKRFCSRACINKILKLKTGISKYRVWAYETFGKKCMACGSVKCITIHHKDENRFNNNISNLQVLCRSCHQKKHNVVLNFNDAYKKQRRDKLGRFHGILNERTRTKTK